jgi:hypothetical protein
MIEHRTITRLRTVPVKKPVGRLVNHKCALLFVDRNIFPSYFLAARTDLEAASDSRNYLQIRNDKDGYFFFFSSFFFSAPFTSTSVAFIV